MARSTRDGGRFNALFGARQNPFARRLAAFKAQSRATARLEAEFAAEVAQAQKQLARELRSTTRELARSRTARRRDWEKIARLAVERNSLRKRLAAAEARENRLINKLAARSGKSAPKTARARKRMIDRVRAQPVSRAEIAERHAAEAQRQIGRRAETRLRRTTAAARLEYADRLPILHPDTIGLRELYLTAPLHFQIEQLDVDNAAHDEWVAAGRPKNIGRRPDDAPLGFHAYHW
jgi:hypothetical protein